MSSNFLSLKRSTIVLQKMLHIDSNFDNLLSSDCEKQCYRQSAAQYQSNTCVYFLPYDNIMLDNNYAEQTLHPSNFNWKNFILIESSQGAKVSAILYILVEKTKANRLNTFVYSNLLLIIIFSIWITIIPTFLILWLSPPQKHIPINTRILTFRCTIYFSWSQHSPCIFRNLYLSNTYVWRLPASLQFS